jgi:hypothetical protein
LTMASTLDDPIIIIDDDDDDEVNKEDSQVVSSLTSKEEEAIQTFMEILNESDRRYAHSRLVATGYNVEMAISNHLEAKSNRKSSVARSTASTPKQPTLARYLPTSKKTTMVEPILKTTPPSSAATTATNLSRQWHDIYQFSPIPFVDPDFPPTQTSLDGRKQASQSTDGTQKVTLCQCQLPASARAVQADGPNYGRFYLACGQQQQVNRGRFRHNDNNDTNSKKDDKNSLLETTNDGHNEKKPVINPYKKKSILSSPAEMPSNKPCDFFQWDKDGSVGSGYANTHTRWSNIAWHSFGRGGDADDKNDYVVYHKSISSDQVRQGAVGNCWFLSALAVVAEKPYLVHKLFPHTQTNDKGCYQVNLCLDGKWRPVVVDSNLPVVYSDATNSNKKNSKIATTTTTLARQDFRGGATLAGGTLVAFPAFCAIPKGQLWPALVEKAYAKAHGSYAQLSGGFIAEGLADLTGAPTTTIVLDSHLYDKDELWARLLSFHEAGFLLGVATSRGGNGLVGGHAYSILSVTEIHDSLVGEQQKVTDFFLQTTTTSPSEPKKAKLEVGSSDKPNRNTIRLVRIRNPWGKREWKGAWSVNSEQWTNHLRKRLGEEAWAKDDGTFWMSFEDMLERFHHMDVCKTREGWVHSSTDGCFEPGNAMESSNFVYTIRASERSWAFISLVQPKKRANTTSRHWYCDPSMIILKRKHQSTEEWACETCIVVGVSRISNCEVFLDPAYEYIVVPFAGIPQTNSAVYSFRLTTYSSTPLIVQTQANSSIDREVVVSHVHKELLKNERKLVYAASVQGGVIVCVLGQGTLYFVAVNCSSDHFLSLRLTVEEQQGTLLTLGAHVDTYDVPPRCQKMLVVMSTDGKFSSTTQVKFNYLSDVVRREGRSTSGGKARAKDFGLANSVDITLAGELAANSVDLSSTANKGGDAIDTYSWIPQLGSMC